MIDYARQGLQYSKDTISASMGQITATQQTLETVNNTFLIPMKDAMTLITIMQSGDAVQNLILGSLGVDPLLVKNPELYIKQKGNEVLDASLGEITAQKGVYSESVLRSLISSSQNNNSDFSTKLKNATKSNIPSMIQSSTCDDTMLSNLAREDVAVPGQPLDLAAYAERKRYFQAAFCAKNANSDPATASALAELQKARPEVAMWDTWLAVTGGDNPKNAAVQAQILVDQRLAEVKTTIQNDLQMGGGIRSLTTCAKDENGNEVRAQYTIDGQAYEDPRSAPCVLEEIKQSSASLLSSFNESLGAPLQTLLAGYGSGAGSLISTAFNTINLVNGIRSGFNSSADSSGSPSPSPNNTVTTQPSTRSVQDLRSNTSAKTTLIAPPIKHLETHLKSLSDLEKTNRNYILAMDLYETKLDAMNSCYNTLAAYPEASGNPNLARARTYYSDSYDSINQLRARISDDASVINRTRTLITETSSKIKESLSSEEILNLFNSYQEEIDSEDLPGIMAGALRDGEYITFKGEVDQSDVEPGPLFNYNNACTEAINAIEAARRAQNAGA